MASSYHLLVSFPDREPVAFVINKPLMTLGRSPDNDIQILVREVSTSHCEFTATPSGCEICDVGSTNGTKVNGHSVKNGKVGLNHHDVILLGETLSAYFVIASADASINIKAEIAEIERVRALPQKPTVRDLTAPVKKEGLPTKKPLVSLPLKTPSPAVGENVGSATVKLSDTPPPTKLAIPQFAKLAPPPSEPAPESPPSAPALPTLPKKVPMLAKPGPPTTPPSPANQGAEVPGGKLAIPNLGAPKTPSLPPPGSGGLALTPSRPPATPKLSIPSLKKEEDSEAPKLSLPAKKVLPKLNLPKKEE